jgi:hypothetical protein
MALRVNWSFPNLALADEAGVSFWLPGQYGSFAAVPSTPGWSFEGTYYHASATLTGLGGSTLWGVKSDEVLASGDLYSGEVSLFR